MPPKKEKKTTTPSPARPTRPGVVRLNKALAQAGVCSRRAADELIRNGRVTVNGRPPEGMGQNVDPVRDDIRLDGAPIRTPGTAAPAYFLLHKPVEVVSTASDPDGRRTVLDLVRPYAGGARLFPVGRLDYFSEGLLLLTSDGELANRMTHPRWHMAKVYRLTVRGPVPEQALATMRAGMTLSEGETLAPVTARVIGHSPRGDSVIELELRQGVNRQIRRMCRDLHLTVLRLVRVAQGPLVLGDLPPGACRPLVQREIEALRSAAGLP
ncbi:pseudouridine synthase [Fundidesulfovibrio butyratiphilus]